MNYGQFGVKLRSAAARLRGRRRPPERAEALVSPVPLPWHRDLFTVEQLEQHARALAGAHEVIAQAGAPAAWLYAVDQTEQQLRAARLTLTEDLEREVAISPAAEWLLDNFHVVTDQIREIREDLPRGFYRQLPKLATGPLAGRPRVYALALELINHTDGRVSPEYLLRFIQAYQSVIPLSMGELWAVVIMLRIGLVENLCQLAVTVLQSREQRAAAARWAERLPRLAAAASQSEELQRELDALIEEYPDLPPPFAVELFRQLHAVEGDQEPGRQIVWLDQELTARYGSDDALLHLAHQLQAAHQVSVGNTITSMRTLSAVDWPDWFERVSLTEQMLRQDPAGVYARCTFATRDHYRHVVEQLARRADVAEHDVARRLLHVAARGLTSDEPHIGYYLVGPGRTAFEAELGYRPDPVTALGRALLRHPTPLYLGALACCTAAVVALALRAGMRDGEEEYAPLFPILLLLPASELAQGLVNWCVTRILPPRLLPRLDLSAGVPAESRTIVVVPMLLLTEASVEGQFDRLEVVMLANSDPHIHFALLSDFADATAAEMPEDAKLLATAAARVDALNARHGPGRFFFFNRRRVWNPQQGAFMGWERKRGKLEEFNRLLAGAADTTFDVLWGDLTILPQIRYVITLDADTQLPRDTAEKLIGTLSHPLNRATVDPVTRRVTAGYGILQPRVAIDLPSATRSRFARLFSGNVGIDPYTTAVSDVYMDLFAEGIYAGKGIYDPAVLRATLEDRFPTDALLSHDLIEGSYAGAGLLTDVELIDGYPATYAAYAARHHRWVRGDWQIIRWLLPRVPDAHGGSTRNILPLSARYRIFDNLRRSLVPAGTVALLAAGWLRFTQRAPGRPLVWTATGLAHLALPPMLGVIETLLTLPWQRARLGFLESRAADLGMSGMRTLVNLVFLADHTVLDLDAITRTLVRLFVTRRNLLEWETADNAQQRLRRSYQPVARRLAPVVVTGIVGAVIGRRRLPQSWPVAAGISLLWLAAPAVAAFIDRPWLRVKAALTREDRALLRVLARQTWRYFEDYVTTDVHWLAPDNVQEDPAPVIAKRTSPTNIGLQLLSDLAARDFGYLGLLDLTERTERVLATLGEMERYHGHLLNWYDTQTLKPLPPGYVSTVDSGNLLGYLLVLRQGYLALRDQPIVGPWLCAGLQDTLVLLREELEQRAAGAESIRPDTAVLDELALLVQEPPLDVAGYRELFTELQQRLTRWTAASEPTVWADRLAAQARSLLRDLDQLLPALGDGTLLTGLPTLGEIADATSHPPSPTLLERHAVIAATASSEVEHMDFGFLFDRERRLFTIGYNVAEGRLDNSFYDLLASESRLGSFVAIANGSVPQNHWFHLGRPLASVRAGISRRFGLLSWSGTMFEYLMPLLVMRTFPATLLDETYHAIVDRQIAYARGRNVPWGISESAYNARDLQLNYQYRAFGVPGLGLKAGLDSELVVAPYATALALPVRPNAALQNLRVLEDAGARGAYGLYEAIDYTPERLPPGAEKVIIRSYMVHHHGMSLLAFDNCLHGDIMQRRFHDEPRIAATELLLQERAVQPVAMEAPSEARGLAVASLPAGRAAREFTTPDTRVPFTHLLSNGVYSVMLTNAGGGLSRCGDLLVTRWREDTTRDSWGSFCYIRDVRSGLTWSSAYQPMCRLEPGYRVVYAPEKAEYHQRVAGIQTRMDVTVTPEDNAEVRSIFLTNLTVEPRELELTSYAEVVLAPAGADAAHPAFSNLFVETEFLPEWDALLASRRPRSAQQQRAWALHVVAVRGHTVGATQFDTDRASFVGRGRGTSNPAALDGPLARRSGAVLDPIFSLRRHIRVAPGATVQVTFTTAIAESREQAQALAQAYQDPSVVRRAFEMAWTQSRVEMRHLGITVDDLHRFQRLAACAFYADGRMRARPEIITANTLAQPGLWPYGVSGDFPIILVRVAGGEDLGLLREVVLAHEFWRLKGLTVELVILNEQAGNYLEEFQQQLLAMLRGGRSGSWLDRRGGIFVVRADRLPEAANILLQTAARAVLSGRRGDLAQHLRHREPAQDHLPPALSATSTAVEPVPVPLLPIELMHRTTYGGFTPSADAFVIDLDGDARTPLPWINVVANENFGFIVSERGSGYTWSENSRENRLTPWSNDPVRDPPAELIFIRDEGTGQWWLPTAGGRGEKDAGGYRVRHGFGYTTFEHERLGVASELTLFVPPQDSVKIIRLRLRNTGSERRRLSATFYAEWTLGVFREQAAPFVVTAFDAPSGALLAHNAYHIDFGERVAFVASDAAAESWTCDRTEFIGRNGSLDQPAALSRGGLAGRARPGLDPCAALQRIVELGPGQEREVIFLLGQGSGLDEARQLIAHYRRPEEVATAFTAAVEGWRERLTRVQVHTPEPAWDALLNGFLLYQTLSCRVWGRSAFYQSGGAYGFRDQLQDVMALVIAAPELTREHLLRAAARQFVEGDVQHWWHPPVGRGIRTKFSDDYLWLPFVADFYVAATGDLAVLDERIPFLEGQALAAGEAERYDQPDISNEQGTLYEHCTRAIDYGLGRMGSHGLPLMGAGDWNDGMNLVGDGGTGESVWVAWFLYLNLRQFGELAALRGDDARAERYRAEAERLQGAVEQHAWDGAWYLRAFFDDGTPLGSAQNDECRIDSLTQSWAVISGAADAERAQQGMAAVEQQLVDRQAGLIKLFTPPFDQTAHDPGYIKGYLPGVRENGGQYTHAALWVIWAYALLGQGDRAGELFTLINPVRHAQVDVERYQVEPYVVAADVYAVPPHTGRGGWTWYTGSASWMYRLGIEMILGLRKTSDWLIIAPCIPPDWPAYTICYQHGSTTYEIAVDNAAGVSSGVARVEVDEQVVEDGRIRLTDDGATHKVFVVLGPQP